MRIRSIPQVKNKKQNKPPTHISGTHAFVKEIYISFYFKLWVLRDVGEVKYLTLRGYHSLKNHVHSYNT